MTCETEPCGSGVLYKPTSSYEVVWCSHYEMQPNNGDLNEKSYRHKWRCKPCLMHALCSSPPALHTPFLAPICFIKDQGRRYHTIKLLIIKCLGRASAEEKSDLHLSSNVVLPVNQLNSITKFGSELVRLPRSKWQV